MPEFKPQPGFQEAFLSSRADITIGGGAAGVGKTHALMLEPLRHIGVKGFDAVYFRRTYAQIEMAGGLWDKSLLIYPYFGGKGREGRDWKFGGDGGAAISFSHLQYEKNLIDHQGAEYALILFDELTHFTEHMFFYLLSRNRSVCGVKPYVMATCNPDPNSWVAKFIDWWIDQKTGLPIPERAGKIRYFYRSDDVYAWGDTKEEVILQVPSLLEQQRRFGVDIYELIKSVTFIPGRIQDNAILLREDPSYIANLLALSLEERMRLLDGNWKISLDKRMIAEWNQVEMVFDNYPQRQGGKYITCDAARYGRDFMVIFVWQGWEVIHICVMKQSSFWDINKEIELLRAKYLISKLNVIVDQDGVGRNTVKVGKYVGFSGGTKPISDRGDRDPRKPGPQSGRFDKQSYEHLKAQCVYRFLELRVNTGMIRINVNHETCKIDGEWTTKIKVGGRVRDIRELIMEDLRSYRRYDPPEVADDSKKLRIEAKEEQRLLLQNRSPDFGDTAFMREYFELKGTRKGARV